MDAHKLIVLSGESGCGKTTLCGRVAELARGQGLEVGGVITWPRFDGGVKVGLDVEDLRSGQRCALAERDDGTDGPTTGRWYFHAAGLDRGALALQQAAPCHLLIVDELGPLELLRGEGWRAGLDVLARPGYRLALAVVRPALVERFQAQLGVEAPVLTAAVADCDALAARILAELGDVG